ncbi:MAG TPA: hypothetical protein VNL13_06285 [Sulfolobales archaeon]|nr:hypothetical protein [Sulfolobales archaeon]
MERAKKIGIIVLAISLISIATAYALNNLVGVINIGGTFSLIKKAEMIPSTVNIDLGVISESQGSRSFDNIAKLVVRNSAKIIAKASPTQGYTPVSGNLSLIINAEMTLSSGNKKYVIQMPCLHSIGECYRILVLIPGYDAPMDIDPGEYSVSLKINWTAQGSGNANVNLAIQIESD